MFPEAFGFGVPADHELLLQVELDLDPRSRSFASLVPGAAAFADKKGTSANSLSGYHAPRIEKDCGLSAACTAKIASGQMSLAVWISTSDMRLLAYGRAPFDS